MDEIFFSGEMADGSAAILKRCRDKSCTDIHHVTKVDDMAIARVMVDSLNSSDYARSVSFDLSVDA